MFLIVAFSSFLDMPFGHKTSSNMHKEQGADQSRGKPGRRVVLGQRAGLHEGLSILSHRCLANTVVLVAIDSCSLLHAKAEGSSPCACHLHRRFGMQAHGSCRKERKCRIAVEYERREGGRQKMSDSTAEYVQETTVFCADCEFKYGRACVVQILPATSLHATASFIIQFLFAVCQVHDDTTNRAATK